MLLLKLAKSCFAIREDKGKKFGLIPIELLLLSYLCVSENNDGDFSTHFFLNFLRITLLGHWRFSYPHLDKKIKNYLAKEIVL